MSTSPAKVEKPAGPVTAEAGGKAVIECLISGNPVPTAKWYRGDKCLQNDSRIQIQTQDDRTILTITKVHFRDEDEYECVVKNDAGHDRCHIKLIVDDSDDEDVDPKTFDLPQREKIHLATDKKFEQKYDSLAELGKGKFGVVKKVKNKETGEVLAAKFIKTSAESKKEVLGEMEMMNHLHSRRLIYLADAYERPGEMIVIMELVTGGELFEKICQDDNLTEKEVIRYMRQILQGVEHMHRKNMVHLDLKPENVLCVIRPDGKEDLKLIDFGMAHILEKGKELKLACGTPEFVAPEVISYEPVHLSSDMWSVGVIAYVLLSGLSPFMGDDDNETIMNVSTAEWDFEDESFDVVSDLSKKYIEELLIKDHSKRNDIYQCLNHEWLKKGRHMEAKKLSTDNLKKFLARRRWQKTSNALRALSRLGSLGLGGGAAPGGGAGGGLLGKMKDGTPAGPPSFVLSLKDCEIVEGTAARFQCQVTGNPEPDVEWYKDGRKLRESKQLTFLYDENDNCKLIITEGRQKDAGEYKVVAVNRHGKVSSSAKLIIKEHASSDEESGGEASDSEISDDATDDEKDVSIRTDSLNKHYKIKDELGKGRFGVVCKCSRISDGKGFAAKFIKCSKEQDKKDVKHEIEIMSVLRHRRLLRLADAFESPTEIVLVMELVTGGELFEKVVEDEFISENDVIHYMKQIIEGVQHMHSKEVLHLDLKPENIMIVRPASRQIKLIDFGLARKYNPKENLKVMFGTPEFVAPEVLTYDRITPATDMWSIGVIAYVLLSGLSPFMGDNDAETLANVQTAEWDFDDDVFDDISDDAKEFISKLLVLKATNRITVEKCLKHPWLTEKRETGKRLKTDRLKAFTARRKWKKALTAIRSTNFLSRLMGSRGSSDGSKKSVEEGGGGGGVGLLARVKAMHSAGVQAPGSGPSSSPFLSPSSAEKAKPSVPAEITKNTGSSSKSPTTTAPSVTKREPPASKTTTPSSKEPIAPSKPSSKTEAKDSTKTDSKATPSNKVSKVTDTNDVSSKPTESNNNISNKEPEKVSDRTKTPTPTTSPPKSTVNDTNKNSDSPTSTRGAKVPTSRKGTPGKLPVWPPPPKERPQKRGK